VLVSVLLTATMFLTPQPVAYVPPIPLLGQAAEQAEQAQARQWAIDRPNRGDSRHASITVKAATFPRHLTGWASCVINRESGGNLVERQSGVQAHNPSGAQGRWQFMPPWNDGGPYMVKDRLEQFGMAHKDAKKVRVYLSNRPIWKWNGWYQDILFIEVNERGGAFHWDGPGC